MASMYEFSRQIADLKKNKQYSEALSYFKNNKSDFTDKQISSNEYIVSDIITCLRHTNIDAGFTFLKHYNINIDNSQKERITTAYGWLLWAKYKAENKVGAGITDEVEIDEEDLLQSEDIQYSKDELIEQIEMLLPLLFQFNNDFSRTLISQLFNIVLKTEKRKATPNWALINDFCDKFIPRTLSMTCSTIQVQRKGRTQDLELASDYENWYSYKTNSLFKLGKWEECLKLSKEALSNIKNFHYSNDAWFSRRIAISKKSLGNTEDAVNELQNILKVKQEWYIQKELSELYYDNDDLDSAFKMGMKAINNSGMLRYKVGLLLLLGKIHKKQGHLNLAHKHILLSKLIRQDEGWKIPQSLLGELSQLHDIEGASNLTELIKELKQYWQKHKSSIKSKNTIQNNTSVGEIIKFLHDNERGKVGFVKQNGIEYYFSIPAHHGIASKVMIGSKVNFKIVAAADGKKERAIVLKIITS